MASIVECYPLSPPVGEERGSDSPSLSAWWYVQADEVLPSPLVRQLAEAASGVGAVRGTPMESLPARGSSLFYRSTEGTNYVDPSLLALDYDPQQADGDEKQGEHDVWHVQVTWRRPEPGAGEAPGQIGFDPILRQPDFEIYFNRETRNQYLAFEVLNEASGQLSADPVLMANAAGEAYPTFSRQVILPMIYVFDNVRSPADCLQRNFDFEDSVNQFDFTMLGLPIRKHFALYDVCEVGGQQFSNRVPYYRRVTKIKLGRFPWYTRFANSGSYYLDGTERRTATDGDGAYLVPPFPLDQNGGLHPTFAHTEKVYLTHKLADFRKMF